MILSALHCFCRAIRYVERQAAQHVSPVPATPSHQPRTADCHAEKPHPAQRQPHGLLHLVKLVKRVLKTGARDARSMCSTPYKT